MPYRNKTYVAFDGDRDIHYYRLMLAWKQNDGFDFNFHNAHDLNTARDTSLEASIKAQLRERMRNSREFVLLVGSNTRFLRKFVAWEIEQALTRDLPIIVVNTNGKRARCDERCPASLRDELAVHISFNPAMMQFALEHWPDEHRSLRRSGTTGPRFYSAERYSDVGL